MHTAPLSFGAPLGERRHQQGGALGELLAGRGWREPSGEHPCSLGLVLGRETCYLAAKPRALLPAGPPSSTGKPPRGSVPRHPGIPSSWNSLGPCPAGCGKASMKDLGTFCLDGPFMP